MDTIIDFIRNMTFWNWLSLIAFVVLPISALNSFFGLRSRWREWRPVKNKETFLRQMKELKLQFVRANRFHTDVGKFFLRLASEFLRLLAGIVIALCMVFLGLFACFISVPSNSILFIYLGAGSFIIGMIFLFYLENQLEKLSKELFAANYPHRLVIKMINLIKKAESKGIDTIRERLFVDVILEESLFTESSKTSIHEAHPEYFPELKT